MAYDELAARLASGLDCRDIVALPDGSVDRYYTVADATGNRIPTQDAFVERISTADVRSHQLRLQAVRAGGQAVNAAKQVDALGQAVRLYGHLDDEELAPLPFPTVSLGTPATVNVLSFDREALMLTVESGDIHDWTIDDLFDALDTDPDEWISDEVVVLQNWVGFPAMTDAIERLATADLGAGTVVFDPGDITGTPADAVGSLCRALATLARSTEVVISANDHELGRLAEVLGVEPGQRYREAQLREVLGVEAVVRHSEPRAVAASDEVTVVENFDADRIERRTGAGDRFDGAIAAGLAADLPWQETLALGNACATTFVENGETGTREDVIELLDARSLAE